MRMALILTQLKRAIHENPELSDVDKFNYLMSLLEKSTATTIDGLSTAVTRTLIGGCLFIYSCSPRLVSFEIKFKFINLKRN